MRLYRNTGKDTKEEGHSGETSESPLEGGGDDVNTSKIPRFLQLARAIHARFTADEEIARSILREAEELVARKNEVIMRSVQEVLDFCSLLREVPELIAALDQKTEDITQCLFSNKCTFSVEREPIVVEYEAPLYRVDMQKPEHISLSRVDSAYLHVSFNPVRFAVFRSESGEDATVTKHLMSKQYRLDSNGTFLHFQSRSGNAADPIADIITELRARLGHDFFEAELLPNFEARANRMDVV